ncbi:hypothetical protein HK096_004898, partial [Nowakowskiella sp. JEL0078]
MLVGVGHLKVAGNRVMLYGLCGTMKFLPILVICYALTFVKLVKAQTNCGSANNSAVCGGVGPCCSEFSYCGATPAQCGGGCNPTYSASGACLSTRTGGQTCQTGYFTFDNNTWVVPSDAYNGNPQTADFTIDRQGLELGNYKVGKNGKFEMLISAPASGLATDPGVGVRLSSTSYITMGSIVTIRLRPTSAGGIVTAFITMADDKDEIDWEWTGATANLGKGQSNFFSKGALNYSNSQIHYPGSSTGAQVSSTLSTETHEYSIDWTSERLNWVIDGVVVRSSTKAALGSIYPTSPARVSFAVWDGGYGTSTTNTGTREWAG